MLSFLPGSQTLAWAGLAAASAPVIIHLLNRRRFRVLDWAAMDFLLDASQRSKTFLELRDLVILALRTAAVALFGLAVARPFFSTGGVTAASGPVHAVVVIDNSLSMGRERLGGKTLLDDARERVADFIERLPPGSRTSIVPLCGPDGSFSFDPHRTAAGAVEAIDAITVVDRRGNAAAAFDLAARAAAVAPDLPTKRVVFIGDQQAVVWPSAVPAPEGASAAAESAATAAMDSMQVVAVRSADTDNSWVDSVQLADGIGDAETDALVTAVVRHEGQSRRQGVQVSLEIDGTVVADQTVDLEPGQAREVSFTHQFDVVPEPERPAFVAVRVFLLADTLPGDDARSLVVPVVARLPVVFADQWGAAGEQPRQNRFGETRHVRRLLAPLDSRGDGGRPLVDVRHVRLDEVDQTTLANVRLLIVAGVRSPEGAVPLLREFVSQGGRLVIAAGADFDAATWQEAGWLDGLGILPAPLGPAVGSLPDEAGELKPFFLDWSSMKDNALFRLPGIADDELEDLYEAPVFFKAITATPDREAAGETGDHAPQVLAAFDNGVPFLVSRQIGQGRVVFVATGLFSPWNTLPRTNAMLLLDRLLRSLLAETLPRLSVDTSDTFTLPLTAEDRRATIRLSRPDGTTESLPVEALGTDTYGVIVRDMAARGVYTIAARQTDLADRERREITLWTLPVSANGPAAESEPRLLDAASFAARTGGREDIRWVDAGKPISADGAQVSGQGSWWWLVLASLGCLVAETVVLARSSRALAVSGGNA